MQWTWTNLIVGVIGVGAIVGGSFMIRYREALFIQIIKRNTSMYGEKLGKTMERMASPTTGVLIPAVGFIVIGAINLLNGVFGHPGQ